MQHLGGVVAEEEVVVEAQHLGVEQDALADQRQVALEVAIADVADVERDESGRDVADALEAPVSPEDAAELADDAGNAVAPAAAYGHGNDAGGEEHQADERQAHIGRTEEAVRVAQRHVESLCSDDRGEPDNDGKADAKGVGPTSHGVHPRGECLRGDEEHRVLRRDTDHPSGVPALLRHSGDGGRVVDAEPLERVAGSLG